MRQSIIIKLRKESLPDAEFALEYEGKIAQSMLIVIQKGNKNEAFLQTPHFLWDYKGF